MAPKRLDRPSKTARSHIAATGISLCSDNSAASLPLNASDNVKLALDLALQNSKAKDDGQKVKPENRAATADLEANITGPARCVNMGAISIADQSLVSRDELSWTPVTHPFAGPLLNAARTVLEMFDGDIGISDDQFWPVVEARRILYGPNDGFVAAFDRHRCAAFTTSDTGNQPIIASTEVASLELSGSALGGTSGIRQEPFCLSLSDPELEAGIRALGKLMRTSEPVEANAPVTLDAGRKYS